MQLLNVINARVTWLFEWADLNPRGKSLYPDLIDWLKDNYHFSTVPASATDLDDTKGLAFRGGDFQAREEIFVDTELTIYNDGLVANTRSSTRDTEAFLDDVLKTAARDFSLNYEPNMIRNKVVLSELVVRLEHPIKGIAPPGMAGFAEKLTNLSGSATPYEFGGVSFIGDFSASSLKLASFMIERRLNAPFKENRFFSKAPFHTDDHLVMLTEFENLIAN